MNKQERKAMLLETLSTKGWEIIQEWLSTRDKTITEAIKKQFINLKEEEAIKWGWYYNGQYTVISDLNTFIANETAEKRTIKKKTI